MQNLSLNEGLIFAFGTNFIKILKSKPYVLEQMGMLRLFGQNLSLSLFLNAVISWKFGIPLSRCSTAGN